MLAGQPPEDVRPGDDPLLDDRARWERRWRDAAGAGRSLGAPSAWVLARCAELPAGAAVVDVAAGAGRHAVPIALSGRPVVAVDFVERAVAAARSAAPLVTAVVADAGALPFAEETLDALLTVNFLDRSLFPRFARLLRPGGRLIVETYSSAHAALVADGRAYGPRNPAYLLAPGELPALVAPLRVVAHEDGRLVEDDEAGRRCVSRIVAERDKSSSTGLTRLTRLTRLNGCDLLFNRVNRVNRVQRQLRFSAVLVYDAVRHSLWT